MATSDEKVVKVGRLKAFWADALSKLSATFAAKSHAHAAATRSAAGFMSAADKAKLDGLSGSGGSDDLLLALLSDTRELEDLAVQGGEFENAGEGWNTFTFPEPFDEVPLVFAQADGYGVDVKGVQRDRFLYMVTQATSSSGSSKTLYYGKSDKYNLSGLVATSNSAGSYWTNQGSFTVLTSAGSSGTSGVAEKVAVRWAAIAKGAE